MQDEKLEKIMNESDDWHIRHLKRRLDDLYERRTGEWSRRGLAEPERDDRGEVVMTVPVRDLEHMAYEQVRLYLEVEYLRKTLMEHARSWGERAFPIQMIHKDEVSK